MAGRHAAPPPAWTRYLLPVATTIGVLTLIVGTAGAGTVMRHFAVDGYEAAPVSDEAVVQPPPPPQPVRTSPSRASRGEPAGAQRVVPTSPTATPRPSRSASDRVVTRGSCQASYYDQGQRTANGERFDPEALTAAHKTLPFDTRVRVTNPANGKSVVVRINDRGPFVAGRCLDLSRAAFRAIAPLSAGHTFVRYEVLR